ncbi:carboxymethylenebutenolidase [Litorimonas taeanensis]|uniref:Carboxymethylenebutenolidase n=1 Tax=Litorimonas taeanensis TaxID=568099 RepID=A0A420WFB9_9PROT|nr:dienelactone hydrolase family protein [Litorimonas taeanensis]RKQ69659.1 carboxymethylenebutenolidase [Litorimonas taeanensis]
MCDDITEIENQGFYEKQITRRDFSLMAGGAAISVAFAGCVPGEAKAGVAEQDVMIETPDGVADAYFAHPSSGAHAAVLIWPDIVGLRPAFKMMAKRLADDGYAALVINPYYRQVKGALVEVGQTFKDPAVREKIIPYARALTQETNRTDARAFVAWLDAQAAVDTSRKIGTTGYCMGGPMTMIAAAEVPNRIGAGASFHGGGLATDKENSPHLLIPKMQADYLIAIAENDDARDPESKTVLASAFADAGLDAEIEVYEGTQHGWCPPDSAVYDEAAANKAWARKLALFEKALA